VKHDPQRIVFKAQSINSGNLNKKVLLITITFIQIHVLSSSLFSQGPRLSYLFDPLTELSWASCYVYLDGGSKQKIPFFPMINYKGSPCGTHKYTRDIHVKGPIVFAGNGIVKEGIVDCYENLDIRGKVVMFCYDFPDTTCVDLEKEISKERRIDEASRRGASAIILFSMKEDYPFLKYLDTTLINIPEIPIIGINKSAAEAIFASAGLDATEIFNAWGLSGDKKSDELICKLSLEIKGKFNSIVTENFNFVFREEVIPTEQMNELVEVNERSVQFILELFEEEQLNWGKSFTAYFRDYDSKLFYVGHWGRGFSYEGGTFMVYDGKIPDFTLAVHENTHNLIHRNWGGSTSFMNEGLGKYAEVKAAGDNKNHLLVIDFLSKGEMLPLEELIVMNIGSDPNTHIAYPAAGSFIDYLITSHGLNKVKLGFQTVGQKKKEGEDPWEKAFHSPLGSLERKWLMWVFDKFNQDLTLVEDYFNRR
jgi:hypothetical protein